MHDTSVELGAQCSSDEGKSRKDAPSDGVPIGTVETPDDAASGVDVTLATDEDDEVTVTDEAGTAFTVPRSALSAVNTETESHEDNETDSDDDADEVETANGYEKSIALDIMELESFVL